MKRWHCSPFQTLPGSCRDRSQRPKKSAGRWVCKSVIDQAVTTFLHTVKCIPWKGDKLWNSTMLCMCYSKLIDPAKLSKHPTQGQKSNGRSLVRTAFPLNSKAIFGHKCAQLQPSFRELLQYLFQSTWLSRRARGKTQVGAILAYQ